MSFKKTLKADIARLYEYFENPPQDDYEWRDTDKIFVVAGIAFIVIIFWTVL